ncbi:porin [Roseateles albus]|uniref:Porin n=1 Tax=Roseateles albus TaxID=2987525 RepID=A0ABT5KG29_9BURK|nr:porin [Roseateles albus]MDC8772880.1 porin [Roseateles albus]
MKINSLGYAAMLLCAGAAQAQSSSVVLYGLLDVNVSNYDSGAKANAGNLTLVQDGTVNGLNGSRWGMRVTEDLGNDLKAGVIMEGGLLADTGALAQGGRAFGRQVFVSLTSASLGELRLGRQYILEDSVMGLSNPFVNALTLNQGTAVTNMGKSLPFWLNAPRADNVVQYATPTWAGFTGTVQIAPGEATADRFHGLKAAYTLGNFNSALSYEWNKSRSSGADTNKSLTLAANYNFGLFKLLGGYQKNDELTTTSGNGAAAGIGLTVTGPDGVFSADAIKGYTIGVEVPLGDFLLGSNYSSVEYSGVAANKVGKSATLGKLGFGVKYGFSKNTFLYSSISFASGDLQEYISQERVMQVGLRKSF